jgi:hypothetical protein
MRTLRSTSFGLCLLLCASAFAQELTADEIARKVLRADANAWEGSEVRVRMLLAPPTGQAKERRMIILGRRKDGGLQTVIRFLAPDDIAGTAFLTLERAGGESEQYIYLSGLKRTRRVAGREREGSFMGSDFSYADMEPIDPKHATNARLPDEDIGGAATYVIESKLAEGAGRPYGKIVTWVRKSDFVALRTRFHDRTGKLVKTLYARRVEVKDGRPVVVESRMQNAATQHATDLVIESIERKEALPDSAFTPAALERL